MAEAEISQNLGARDGWHDRWLAMQSAYTEYRRSSEALECTRRSTDDPLRGDPLRLTMLEGQQRLAFERYLDARIAFLESRFDEISRPDDAGTGADEPTAAVRQTITGFRAIGRAPVLQALAVALICTTAFSLVREQGRVRKLETGVYELRTTLGQVGLEIEKVRQDVKAAVQSKSPPSQSVRVRPPGLKPLAAPKRKAQTRLVTADRSPGRSGGRAESDRSSSATTPKSAAGRSIQSFSLSPSHKFSQVGPISVLVQSINTQTNTARLSIMTMTGQIEVESLRSNHPVWLRIDHREHSLGLVADRITANHLDGHLLEENKANVDVSRLRSKADSP